MKFAYLAISELSLIVLLSLFIISIATPIDEVTASYLLKNPDDWSISTSGKLTQQIKHLDIKNNLLVYFEKTVYPAYTTVGHYQSIIFVIFIFSLTGYLRERHIEKGRSSPTRQ